MQGRGNADLRGSGPNQVSDELPSPPFLLPLGSAGLEVISLILCALMTLTHPLFAGQPISEILGRCDADGEDAVAAVRRAHWSAFSISSVFRTRPILLSTSSTDLACASSVMSDIASSAKICW
jgi:hypothetical protein